MVKLVWHVCAVLLAAGQFELCRAAGTTAAGVKYLAVNGKKEGVVTTDAFVVTVAIAQGDLFAEDLGDAVAEYMDLYDDAEGIAPEQLDDGWLFTASGGAGAHVVMARRLVAGTVYSVSASLDTEERQEAAVLFAKSLRHG